MIHRLHPGVITVIREVKSAYKEVGGGGHNCGEQKTQIQSSNYARHVYIYIRLRRAVESCDCIIDLLPHMNRGGSWVMKRFTLIWLLHFKCDWHGTASKTPPLDL